MTDELKKTSRVRLKHNRHSGTIVRAGTQQPEKVVDKKPEPSAEEYKPTPQERMVIQSHRARTAAAIPVPRLKLADGKISLDHPHKGVALALFMEALGTHDRDVVVGLINQLAEVVGRGWEEDEDKLNFVFSVLRGIAPKDTIGGMLATQMVVVHNAFMRLASQLAPSRTILEQDIRVRMLSKLVRASTDLADTLSRHRTIGQNAPVQHVSVSPGAQAIVTNVGPAVGRTAPEKDESSAPSLADSPKRARRTWRQVGARGTPLNRE